MKSIGCGAGIQERVRLTENMKGFKMTKLPECPYCHTVKTGEYCINMDCPSNKGNESHIIDWLKDIINGKEEK